MAERLTIDEMIALADRITSWKKLPVSEHYYRYKDMVDEVQVDTTKIYTFEGSLESSTINVSKIDSDNHWPGPGRGTSYEISINTDGVNVGQFGGVQIWPLYHRLENAEEERKQNERKSELMKQEMILAESVAKTRSQINQH